MNRNIVLLAALLVLVACESRKPVVSSPDGNITVAFFLEEGIPSYSVDVDGQPFILPSLLGLVTREQDLSGEFKLKRIKHSEYAGTWQQPWGENKTMEDRHREMMVSLVHASGTPVDIRFRVFDDGLGFRYEVHSQQDTLTVLDERTEFSFAQDATTWSIPGDFNSYEHEYRVLPLSQLKDANTPVTLRWENGLHASVHEAALYDFPEMVLAQESGTAFKASLAPYRQEGRRRRGQADASSEPVVRAYVPGEFQTAWRTIQIARSAVGLVNSSLILNLNEPSKIEDTSWIKPIKYIGVWWSLHLGIENWGGEHHGATTERALQYVDFAAANNIQGVLFEGWNDAWDGSNAVPEFDFTRPAPDFDVKKVTEYAREKGILYITHNETGGNVARFEEQLERSLDWEQKLGIHGLKTGYAGGGLYGGYPRHGQVGVKHFQHVVEEAAKRQIMVDGHEVIKATGIRRTWPNFMTRECAKGMEYNGWSKGNAPSHHETLPYTRLLGGPMDYTPGVFDVLYRNIAGRPQVRTWGMPGTKCRVNTTLVKQIANWVVLYSPMQMACDLIENYDGHPAFQFFRDFEADCDESHALQGEVGEYISIVRRAGDRYFYGATTNEAGRTLTEPLTFLPEGVTYKAIIYADASDAHWETNPYAYEIREQLVTRSDTLTVHLAPGGGQAITFHRAD